MFSTVSAIAYLLHDAFRAWYTCTYYIKNKTNIAKGMVTSAWLLLRLKILSHFLLNIESSRMLCMSTRTWTIGRFEMQCIGENRSRKRKLWSQKAFIPPTSGQGKSPESICPHPTSGQGKSPESICPPPTSGQGKSPETICLPPTSRQGKSPETIYPPPTSGQGKSPETIYPPPTSGQKANYGPGTTCT
jgi:hypothetical protein